MAEHLVDILLFFIGASLLLYVILGGADYGAGLLELLPAGPYREKQKQLVNEAMGPVWEANHMWLIIVVVILFMGFPPVFTTLMTALHLPMVALLVGIVIRGSVFTFRHYDAIQEPRSQAVYTVLFGLSSLWTSLWLGIIAGSLYRGRIDPETIDPWTAYVAPWWGLYPLSMGLFVSAIFAFLASIYLIGETKELAMKRYFVRRAFVLNILVVFCGGFVFLTSWWEGGSLAEDFFRHPIALACMAIATLMYVLLWSVVRKSRSYATRVVAAGQGALILFGWFSVYAPNALVLTTGPLSFYAAAAPTASLWQLVLALLVGSVFIFPSLFFLLKVFKSEKLAPRAAHEERQ